MQWISALGLRWSLGDIIKSKARKCTPAITGECVHYLHFWNALTEFYFLKGKFFKSKLITDCIQTIGTLLISLIMLNMSNHKNDGWCVAWVVTRYVTALHGLHCVGERTGEEERGKMRNISVSSPTKPHLILIRHLEPAWKTQTPPKQTIGLLKWPGISFFNGARQT